MGFRATRTLLAAALAAAALASPARAEQLGGFYGINVQEVFRGPLPRWEANLAAVRTGGLQVARIDARWENVEPRPPRHGVHAYNWSHYDRIVAMLARYGLRWLPIVDYSTSWSTAAPGQTYAGVAPAYVPDFLDFAGALARRYGRGGDFWRVHASLPRLPVSDYEIWNEQNATRFWRDQADAPERYADLYAAARAAIRRADPQAHVLVGGLALSNPPLASDEIDFVRRMYAHRPQLAGNVDGVGLHPYQRNLPDTYMRLRAFRQALDQIAGPEVPIEITEVGWPTTLVTDAERAAYLAELAEELPRSDCDVDRFIPYTWVTSEADPGNPEDWFGLAAPDGAPKPSGRAYLRTVRLMRGLGRVPPPPGRVAICHLG